MGKEMGDKLVVVPNPDKTNELFQRRDGHDEQQATARLARMALV
jgi:hypothetical protein